MTADTDVILEIGGGLRCPRDRTNLDPYYGSDHNWLRKAEDGPWPVGPATFTHVIASHVLEHIPAGEPRVRVFNEVFRVLKPGGMFEIRVPLFPTPGSVSDPGHVSFFVPDSFRYFCNPPETGLFWYVWNLHRLDIVNEWEIHCTLRKPFGPYDV